jgi:small-conductance mechanosensitive channel
MRLRAFTLLLAFFAALCLTARVEAQPSTQRPFATVVSEWDQSLELVSRELLRPELPEARAMTLRDRLAAIRQEARQVQAESEAQLKPLHSKLGALGPAPQEGAAPESAEIAKERQTILEDIAFYEGRIKQAALIIKRADDLTEEMRTRSLDMMVEHLLKSFPLPFLPGAIAEAVPEFLDRLAEIARAPADWWNGLPAHQRQPGSFGFLALIVILAAALGLAMRFALIRWLGRDPRIEQPSYARRLYGALAEGLANGMLPALFFGALLYRVNSEAAIVSGFFASVISAACGALILFVLAWALPRAVLAPELPSWRLVNITAGNALRVSRLVTVLAGVFALDLFLENAARDLEVSDALASVYLFVTNTLEAGLVLALLRRPLWAPSEETLESSPEEGGARPATEGAQRRNLFWLALRLAVGIMAIATIVSSLIGYANLGAYLVKILLLSTLIIGGLVLLRGLARELIGALLRSRFLREQLALGHGTRQILKFWIRSFLDLALCIAGVLLVLPLWGIPLNDILDWTWKALEGFQFGDVRISVAEILAAIAVFVVAVVVTRLLQRVLSERVLPHTSLDSGLRHSLSTGFGYLGLIVAAALGIAALGLDLTNLALIFGALSVGIGFGLQHVANNFISGLILLIERPIKVGDWVVVGANEGYVKRINLRATEIETFQRASIVIPNSEIVSTAVVNWTHRDRYGRVDVPVGVAYGSDVELVTETLERCLRENKDVVDWPAPYVLFRGFGESALEFSARGFIANIEYVYGVQSALLTAIDKAFREAEIEIPFPQRDLHLKNLDQLAEALRGRRPGPAAQAVPGGPPRLREVEGGSGEGEG